ncbi:MAG: glycosyltransferase [Bacteroidetes bacterium]|nr:glycosyltransferase [Bacteroidota bacterium]
MTVFFGRIIYYFFSVYWNVIAFSYRKSKQGCEPRIFFGMEPLINNKYWANALKKAGYKAQTVMKQYYGSINQKNDFDLYVEDILKDNYWVMPTFFKYTFRHYFVFDFLLKHFDIFHISCDGIILNETPFRFNEGRWIKKFGGKIVVIPYGGDFLQYSMISNFSYLHGLLTHYPKQSVNEALISKSVEYWGKECDAFIASNILEGKSRWDVLPFCNLSIDTQQWEIKKEYNLKDGVNEEVVVVHSPNHKTIKGSEFIVNAVEELRKEGLKVRFILIEKFQNEDVRRILSYEADILAEQLLVGYAMSAVEGMALGLPVISNLEYEPYTRVYRRFSYLNESPVLSSTPENIKENLKILIRNPQLRKELGMAGRKYVEKYHSEKTAQYMFGKIYDKIWFGKTEIDLMNMFHPLNPNSYNSQSPKVEHPLVENKIPSELFQNLNK